MSEESRTAKDLERGDGARPDPVSAAHWYQQAALRGDALAKKHLRRIKRGEPIDAERSDEKPPRESSRRRERHTRKRRTGST